MCEKNGKKQSCSELPEAQLSFLEAHIVCLHYNIGLSGVLHWQTYGPQNLIVNTAVARFSLSKS